jgi:hypothetical protein
MKPLNPAFFGIWKENSAKGRESESTVTFERKADGIHMGNSKQGFAYDGQDHSSSAIGTTAWKKTGARSYESIMKNKGKPIGTTTRSISADGKAMTVIFVSAETGSRSTTVWNRVGTSADSDPLIGTWKLDPTSRITETPSRMIIEKVGDAIRVSNGIPGKAVPDFTAKFDGAEQPWRGHKGKIVATVSLKQLDERAFVETLKLSGAPFTIQEFVLAPDARTIKKTTTIVGQTPRTSVVVYEKE